MYFLYTLILRRARLRVKLRAAAAGRGRDRGGARATGDECHCGHWLWQQQKSDGFQLPQTTKHKRENVNKYQHGNLKKRHVAAERRKFP